MLFLLHEIGRVLLRAAARRRAVRQMTARLSGMTDRRLDDIGVTRGDILVLAERSYPRSPLERAGAPHFTLDTLPVAG